MPRTLRRNNRPIHSLLYMWGLVAEDLLRVSMRSSPVLAARASVVWSYHRRKVVAGMRYRRSYSYCLEMLILDSDIRHSPRFHYRRRLELNIFFKVIRTILWTRSKIQRLTISRQVTPVIITICGTKLWTIIQSVFV